jgi:hypothetical protein
MSPFDNPLQNSPCNVVGVHFKCPKLKPKLKIGSNEFLL